MIRNQAGQSIGAELINASTGAAFVGVVTVYVTVDAGTQAIGSVGSGVCTAEGNGFYTYRPSQTETDGAIVAFTFIGTGAIPATIQVATITTGAAAQLASSTAPFSDTTFNARSVITDALIDLGVLEPGDALTPSDGAIGLRALNRFISSLKTQNLSFPFVDREVFSVVAGQSTYTIGPVGADFITARPQSLTGAGLLMPTTGATTGRLEIPRGLLTDDAYANIRLKDMQAALWTDVYYQPTYAAGLGSVYLWPTPNSTTYDLVLYRGDVIQGFANLTTFYDFPPGYAEMLQFNLEKRLCRVYGKSREWGALDDELARDSIRLVKRQNFKLTDTVLDGTLSRGRPTYMIQVGNG